MDNALKFNIRGLIMKNYISGSLKVLVDYAIMLLLFFVFLLAGINHLAIYSSVIFILGLFILYSDFNTLALKERKPAYNIVNYPLKGLLMGFLGFSPIILIVLVLNFLDFGSEIGNTIRGALLKIITGPIFGFLSSNLLLLLLVPAIVTFAYMAGYYGKEIPRFFKPKPRKKVVRR
jgi:hypothetical protein